MRVVADEVDDGQALFAVVAAQAAAELLEEDDGGLGGAEHDDAIERREVDAFVEDVDDAEGVELALEELGDGGGAIRGARCGEDGGDANVVLGEPGRGEAGVVDGAAEDEGAGARVLVPGSPEAVHACLGLYGGGQRRGIEAAVAPGDGVVVDVVAHAVVDEGDEAAAGDAGAFLM
jgi:hypothetical protein